MDKASKKQKIQKILIQFYTCELRTFKRILGLKWVCCSMVIHRFSEPFDTKKSV